MVDNELIEKVKELESCITDCIAADLRGAPDDETIVSYGFECVGSLLDLSDDSSECTINNSYKTLIEELKGFSTEELERLWIWENSYGICIVTYDNGNGYCSYSGTLGKTIIDLLNAR